MSVDLKAEINKRLTMNLLIQGAASHTFLTTHHLVRDELNAEVPNIVELYDRVVVSCYASYWIGDMVMLLGRPRKFWKRVTREDHPFHSHDLMARHGGELSETAWAHASARAKEKNVSIVPGIQAVQNIGLVVKTIAAEKEFAEPLARLAVKAVSEMWKVPDELLDAEITNTPAFGHIREPETRRGRLMRSCGAGWSSVLPRDGKLRVVAKAIFWPLLAHELVKGTAELVCLHGLNKLDDTTYAAVIDATDHIEYEVWMMQIGAELYRRWLSAKPSQISIAECLMQLALRPPKTVETIMLAVLEEPEAATAMMSRLAEQ
ncbi:MAG: hypothetical protein AB8G99_11520 [Planctomycetaceae bacterium]